MIRAFHSLLVTDAGKTSRHGLVVLVATMVIVMASFAGLLFTREQPVLVFLDNLHWTVAYTAGAWLAWIGVASAAPENKSARRWFALGLTAYAAGQWVWDVQLAIDNSPFPGPSDLLFLALGPACVLGLWSALRTHADPARLKTVALDVTALSVAVLAMTLAVYLPLRGDTNAFTLGVMVLYPLTLLMAACVGVVLVPTLRLRAQAPWLVFMASLALNGALWMEWNTQTLNNSLQDGSFFNSLFSFAAVGMGLGAMSWRLARSPDPAWDRRCEGFLRSLPLVLVMAVAAEVALVWTLPNIPRAPQVLVTAGAAVVAALAIGRQSLALGERDRLLAIEHEVAESQVRFRTLFETAHDGIILMNERHFTDCNSSACAMYGCRRDELVGRSPLDFSPAVQPDGRNSADKAKEKITAALAGEPQAFEWKHHRLDGGEFDAEVRLNRVQGKAGFFLQAIVRDVTARKQSEQALRQSEERFRQVAETIQEVFWILDSAKRAILYVSPAYETIWGRTCSSLYEHRESWLESVHDEDRERMRNAAATKQTAGTYDERYRIVRPDGTVRWIRDRAFPVRDRWGQIQRIVGVAQDITAERQLEEQLRHSQKMEGIGQLSGGVAHDFNNILTIIQGHLALLKTDPTLSEESRESAVEIGRAAERAANLTRQLLTFSRQQALRTRPLDLNDVVANTTRMLERIVGEDIRMEVRLAPHSLPIQADEGMLDQILLNLAVNARDAMPVGGRLSITTAAAELDEAKAARIPAGRPGTFACLAVADTGSGIPAEILPRIFEPFFTTKDVGRGTGLGLATVYGIVQQHDGFIEVTSKMGVGSTFRIWLPRVSSPAADSVSVTTPGVRGGNETILVVEDEPAVRLLVRHILTRLGYQVVEASSGRTALELWPRHRETISLLVTDLVMPDGLNGRELAQRLQADRPELRVLYTSGYSADIAGPGFQLFDGVNFLAKPYRPERLAEMVRLRLDS